MDNSFINDYIYTKVLITILFGVSEEKEEWMYGTDKLEGIKEIVEEFCLSGLFSKQVKSNIFDYLTEARNIKDDDYEYRIKLINEIICVLNLNSYNNSNSFYRVELYRRRDDKRYLNKYPDYVIEGESDLVNRSIVYDALVLLSHDKKVDDETFKKEFLPDLTKQLFYYESINIILDGCPIIFKDPTFYNRFVYVLNQNNELSNNEFCNSGKKIINKVNKKIKKV